MAYLIARLSNKLNNFRKVTILLGAISVFSTGAIVFYYVYKEIKKDIKRTQRQNLPKTKKEIEAEKKEEKRRSYICCKKREKDGSYIIIQQPEIIVRAQHYMKEKVENYKEQGRQQVIKIFGG